MCLKTYGPLWFLTFYFYVFVYLKKRLGINIMVILLLNLIEKFLLKKREFALRMRP